MAGRGGHPVTLRTGGVPFLLVVGSMVIPRPAVQAQQPGYGSVPAGLDLYMPSAAGTVPAGEVVALGRLLFFDPILSRDSTVACATCHDPSGSFTNGRVVAEGIDGRQGRRNVPAIINRGYGEAFFWDGRVTTLEEQVVMPIEAEREMDSDLADIVRRLGANPLYRERFRGTHQSDPTADALARSLAAYIRTIRSGDSRFDRFMDDGDVSALSELEVRGLRLFQGRARCSVCHLGPNLTDEQFHNTGVAFADGMVSDSGRAAVTGRPEDLGAFKVPTLRNVEHTAPYMHDGSLPTLEAVIDFYDRGGNANANRDTTLRVLHLSNDEKLALVTFLRALSGEIVEGNSGLPP